MISKTEIEEAVERKKKRMGDRIAQTLLTQKWKTNRQCIIKEKKGETPIDMIRK